MSLRLVSSAKNLRDQFKGGSNSNNTLTASSGLSITTANSGKSNAKTLDSNGLHSNISSLSRQGTLLRSSSSNGNLRHGKGAQKKTLISKVFADESGQHEPLSDLSMEMTLLIVKRCVKEIRERGLTTKGILRQVQMGHSQKVVMDTIRLILDDEANTELSALRQVDIHLVAHAMKWAIRYSEETLVTYEDYQVLYLDQDRSFSRFVHDLPPTNRAILLDLFSLCADVTLLAHLNNMTLVTVAKAISLSIMAEPEREFTTFDASLQQRNMWGAACEDLLRAFLRIKTSHDLAKIEQEDEVDENRYVDNITRVVKSARHKNNESSGMHSSSIHPRSDISVPSSAGSSIPPSSGWPSAATPNGALRRSGTGYFDYATTPRSASPLPHNDSLSRSHSLAQSNSSRSRPISPSPFYEHGGMEYEEIMQDRSHLDRLRHSRHSQAFEPGNNGRRRSSVADVESLYMLPIDSSTDGYESEPEPIRSSLLPDFADGLGWDFSKVESLHEDDLSLESGLKSEDVNRSNSSNSNGSAATRGGQLHTASPDAIRNLPRQQPSSAPVRVLQDSRSPVQGAIQRSATFSNKAQVGHAIAIDHTSPSLSPQRAKRSSLLRRSVSLDPHTMHGRVHKKPNELRHDILTRELAIRAERSQVAEDIRSRLLQVKQSGPEDVPSSPKSTSSLESSPPDPDRPHIPTRSASQGLGRSMSKPMARSTPKTMPMSKPTSNDAKLEINVGSFSSKQSPLGTTDELTPISNPSLNPSVATPKPQQQPSSNTEKKLDVLSRPKDVEINVHFTPIIPISPRTEMKSKFQESFSEPISPPQGYAQGQVSTKDGQKRSPVIASTKSGQSSKMSPSSSTIPSPMQSQSVSRSNSRNQTSSQPITMPPLQQSVSSSGVSFSSQNSTESKSKAAGFIRALSYKLRSKQSDEQLKPTKINNQVISTAPIAPAVPNQPPRLELSFLGEVPSSAPKKQGAEINSLPAPTSADQQGSDRPKGFTGARRPSGALLGSGNVAIREQRRKSRTVAALPRSSPSDYRPHASSQASSAKADGKRGGGPSGSGQPPGRSSHRLSNGRTLSDSSYTTDDSSSFNDAAKQSSQPSTATSPKKAGEREYRFSTATLLKDGKLYYQLQWDDFTEGGFKSDFFHEPEQYLTGLHQKRMSKVTAGGPGMNSSATAGKTKPPTNSTTSWDHASDRHLGQDQGPSPAQRAAAMKAARESFIALAKDPKALAALKAGSTDGISQATIIGTGSFPSGSTQPVLHSRPLNLNWDAVPPNPASPMTETTSPKMSSQQTELDSIGGSSNSARRPLLPVKEDANKPLRSMSGESSSMSSAAGTVSLDTRKEIAKPGKPSTTVGGAGLSSFSPLARGPVAGKDPMAPVSNPAMPLVKPPKKSRLFGTKVKVSKKTNRLSTSVGPMSAAMVNSNLSNTNLTKKKKLPPGVVRKDVLTRTEETLDEVFPWTCIEHMAGQDSGWVMLEPVQDGAVGWVKIDKLEEEIARLGEIEKMQKQQQQQQYQQHQQQQQQPKQQPQIQQHQMMEREP
ncbi:hypothetical protein BGZ54_008193 [Gamsiella multidivaricata]|nr:hypothetical protein BGZ54_008193 [Gamsiella multidivaricata]